MRGMVVVIASLLVPMRAAADPSPPERAAVVAIDMGPGTPSYQHATATRQLEAGLAGAGYDIVPDVEVVVRLAGELAKCRDGACVRLVGQALGARALVFATIERKDESTAVAVRLYDGATGQRQAELREVCDLCGEAELSAKLSSTISTLRSRALDARLREEKRAADAQAAREARARSGERRSSAPGLLVGAVGAIAAGGGLYLLAIDGDGTCHRGDQPEYPAPGAVIRYPDPEDPRIYICRDIYRTRTAGLAAVAGGAVAIVAGIALVIRAHHRERAVEIVPRPGGAAVGVRWSW